MSLKKLCYLLLFVALLVVGVLRHEDIWHFCQRMISILMPIIAGACVAFVLSLPMIAIEKKLKKYVFKKNQRYVRLISLTLVLVLLGISISIFLVSIIPQLNTSLASLFPKIPPYLRGLQALLIERFPHPAIVDALESIDWDLSGVVHKVQTLINDNIGALLSSSLNLLTVIFSSAFSLILTIVFATYLLFSKEKLGRQLTRILQTILPEKTIATIQYVSGISTKTFSSFIFGQCLEALILGVIVFFLLTIFGFPYAALVSTCISITAIFPIVGAFVGCGLGAFFILIESPTQALIFVCMFVVLQQLEGNILYPKIVGNSIGLPAPWILLAVTVGGSLFGVWGILLFVPLAAIVYQLIKNHVLYIEMLKKEKMTAPPCEEKN